MKIVIDIDDEQVLFDIKNRGLEAETETDKVIINALYNGTPLPNKHGRLIDADELLKAIDTWDKFGYTETGCFVREPGNDYVPYVHYEDMVKSVSGASTIIEAESEEK